MIEFETPTSFHELIHCLEDIDAHYVGRRYAYEEYELYDLIFDRYEFTNKTDEEIESEATTYSENKINLEKNAYLCELNAENAKYTHIEQNVSAMETEEKNKIISEYNKRIENLRADAVKRGVASSTALVNAINLIESERSDKLASTTAKYLNMSNEVKGEKEKIAVKIQNAESYFGLKLQSEKEEKIKELKEKRSKDIFEQYDYNMRMHEKEVKNLNMLNRARMHLSLEYIAITHEPLTNPQKDVLGYFKDVIKVMDQYFYTLDAVTAYEIFLREGILSYYLTSDYYSIMREKYNARIALESGS